MAYDYEKAKAAYESLTPEQQQQYVDRNKNNATVQQFARDYAREKSQTSTTTTTPTPNYQNQGAGNYVYNEKTGFYENQTDTSKNTVNQGIAPRPETKQEVVRQETPVKQEETVISTDTKNNQSNVMTPLSNDYYNQTSDEALNKIRNNLNQYRQTNPEYFSDYDSFKKNFSYDLRNDEQKNVLDTWYTGYTKGLELSATPTTDLYTQYQNGQISINDLENLRVSNPTKYAELTAQINKGNIISAYDDDKGTDSMNIQEMAYEMAAQTFKAFMEGGSGASSIFAEYEEKMNDPEMLALSDQCTEYEAEIEQIQDDIASMKKQVEAEYEGTGASRAKINAIIADRTYDLQLQLRTANSNYNKVANQYNNRMQQYQQEYTMKLQEYQLNMQERKAKMDELGFAMDLMNFETNEQKQEREWNYWVKQQQYTNGDINSSDYSTRYKAALKSVENLLSQYEGIPMVRSAEQMAQDVLKAIDEGSDLGTELTKINKQIQQKDEYKKLYNQTFGTASASGLGKTFKIGDQEYVVYDDQLYTAEDFNNKFSGKISYTPVSPETMSTGLENFKKKMQSLVATGGAIRKGWCGEPVNDYLKSIGSDVQYDNELSTKLNSITPGAGPKVGSIAIWDGSSFSSPDAKKYGHVGIVTAIDEKNGKITVLESNGQAHSMGMGYGTYNMANVTGYFDPTAGYGSTESSTSNGIKKNYVETRVGLYDKYINEGTAPTDAKLKALGDGDIDKGWQIFDAEVQDYMDKTGAGTLEKRKNDEVNKLRTEMHQQDAYKDYSAMKGYYEKIKNATNNKTATPASDVSLLFAYMKMLDPKSIVRESEFATAQNMGSLPTKWHAQLKSAVNGEKLTDSQRTEILKETETLMDSATYLYNNLLDDYTSMINYGGDASKLGKKGTYITSEYINKYGNGTSTSSKKGVKRGNTTQTATTNGSGIQSTNFYQTYANTAPASNQKYYVNGVLVEW